ncbi:hypothetical protein ACI797_16205 [Geodermatophilus sp. SYSU D00691]
MGRHGVVGREAAPRAALAGPDVAADEALGAAYVAQADWDPRRSPGYVFLVLRPVRLQAWREADEIPGRTLMRDGAWLV